MIVAAFGVASLVGGAAMAATATAAVFPTGEAATAKTPAALLKTDEAMAVTIPFNFVVDRKTMPAGRYDIGPVGEDGDRVAILGTADEGVLVAPGRDRALDSGRMRPDPAMPALVFDKIGDTYYLSRAHFPGLDAFSLRVKGVSAAETQATPAG
jgi:hypothetical protein